MKTTAGSAAAAASPATAASKMAYRRSFDEEKSYLYRDAKSKCILNVRKGFVPGMTVLGMLEIFVFGT